MMDNESRYLANDGSWITHTELLWRRRKELNIWINIDEQIPEKNEVVVIKDMSGNFHFGIYERERFFTDINTREAVLALYWSLIPTLK